MLSADDFSDFFEEVYGHDPFPWQKRLLRQVAAKGEWPAVLDLPTGSGKTAAIDIAVFHLALESGRPQGRRAPVRIAFVVDRRLVVDDALERAEKLVEALANPQGLVTKRVAERLRTLSGDDGPPLLARRLRGGIPREDDWARTPSQPTVLCSTVDQIGSRLLFRGYGVTNSMKPVHAGLIGSDCLILLDEAHLAEPFQQTLGWVSIYKGDNWRESDVNAPWDTALLTATPGGRTEDVFPLDENDKVHPVLKRRLEACKPAILIPPAKSGKDEGEGSKDDAGADYEKDVEQRAQALLRQVAKALEDFRDGKNGVSKPAIGVVANRVARARRLFELLHGRYDGDDINLLLLIGPARPVERDRIARRLEPIRTGADRNLGRPLVLVATQCIEAGVDIDLDALITEAAPLDSLRQRFGRLNRDGRKIEPYAAVIAAKADLLARTDDPVYGTAIKPAWDSLNAAATKKGKDKFVDFGINQLSVEMRPDALTDKPDAPVLLPAHLDLLSQSSPVPAADPEVALYLHGSERQPDTVTVIWRGDIDAVYAEDKNVDIRRILTLVRPRSGEAIELPLWAVRRWLNEEETDANLADIASREPGESGRQAGRLAFRWRGDTEDSRWIGSGEIRPGDTIVVPASYGGVDEYGWNPACTKPAKDVAQNSAEPYAGRRFAVRVAPGLLEGKTSNDALADAISEAETQRLKDIRYSLLSLDLPDEIRSALERLNEARKNAVNPYTDLYGYDEEARPRGIVFVTPLGLELDERKEDVFLSATEDDIAGSTPGFCLSLEKHSSDVEAKAKAFARSAGLPEARIHDLQIAGYLHDTGKADPRFQAWLYYGDPFGPDPDEAGEILAKSNRALPRRARVESGLPRDWRHEALSVRLALLHERLNKADDPELVLWLVGTHHGFGRPFFPHQDPEDNEPRSLPRVLDLPSELSPGAGPQSLAFDYEGLDWAKLFERLKARYGVWELARMEAIVRLADHRASEYRAREASA